MYASPSDLHFSVPLTNVAIAYVQSIAGLVARRVFPEVNVSKQSDRYYVFDRAGHNRAEFRKRAPATESRGMTLTLSDDTYFAEKWALHHDIPDEMRANADAVFNLDRTATNNLTWNGLLTQEVQFMAEFMTTGVWSSDKAGVDASPGTGTFLQWDDPNSTPIEDVASWMTEMQIRTGFRPNKMVMGQQVKDKLVRHPDIVDLIKYGGGPTNPALVTDAALAAILQVPQLFIMGAIQNTALEGEAESNAFIGGKKALLVFSPDAPSIETPSAGYTFNWTGYLGGSPNGIRISSFRMEHLKSDRVEAEMFFDQKKTSADLGIYIDTAVA